MFLVHPSAFIGGSKIHTIGSTLRPLPPTAKNSALSYDFVYDACVNGQKIKCLTVVDEYTRECLAIDVSGAIL